MTPLTAEQAAALDAPHVVHAVDATGAYVGLVQLAGDLVRVSGPPPGDQWRWEGDTWVPAPTIAQAKAQRWEDIKAQRELLLRGTFTSDGRLFDLATSGNLSGAVLDAFIALTNGEQFGQFWVLADNTAATLTAAETIAAGRLAKGIVTGLWQTSQALREEIDAIDDDTGTLAEVAAVVWPA
jgi:hypothetical protein